jgi:hypothetical protein
MRTRTKVILWLLALGVVLMLVIFSEEPSFPKRPDTCSAKGDRSVPDEGGHLRGQRKHAGRRRYRRRADDEHPESALGRTPRDGLTRHDAAIAESLAEELAPIGYWPASVTRIRCERNGEDVSVSSPEWRDESPRDPQTDLERLGPLGEMPVHA